MLTPPAYGDSDGVAGWAPMAVCALRRLCRATAEPPLPALIGSGSECETCSDQADDLARETFDPGKHAADEARRCACRPASAPPEAARCGRRR